MNIISLRSLNYYGDDFYFESPEFNRGLNIITGDNGAGKSTFSDLIYYSMGGTVKQFNSSETEIHEQILNDKNNHVEAVYEINGELYKFYRKFNSAESNIIIVESQKDMTSSSYFLNRSSDDYTFSDWLLDKLSIPKLELYQGTKSFMLGFTQLLRLLYHHQLSDSHYIHKQPDGRSNFVNDSLDIRKTIFEVLTSDASIEYYESINNYKLLYYKKLSKQSIVDALLVTNSELHNEFGKVNKKFVQDEIHKLESQKNVFVEQLNELESRAVKNYDEDVERTKRLISKTQEKINKLEITLNSLANELDDFYSLYKIQTNEIKNIERILLSSENLGLFTPNKCPICGNKPNRTKGKCVCGETLDERIYQNFFYTRKDHDNILKTKKVAINTTKDSIEFSKEEIREIEIELTKLNNKIDIYRDRLISLVSDTPKEQVFNRMKKLNQSITEVERKIESKRNLFRMLQKYEEQFNELVDLKDKYQEAMLACKQHEIKHKVKMQSIVKKFSEIYQEFLTDTDKEILNAKIDSDYMPIINEGYYKNTASKVHRRFFYFLTLLKLSIVENIPSPRFLIADTPQNFGIDANALKDIFTELDNFCTQNKGEKYQIILTIKKDFIEHLEGDYLTYNISNKLLLKRED